MAESTYEAAGVSLDAAREVKRRIAEIVSSTGGPEVLAGVGSFGAMYGLAGYRNPVLVSSTDGVGTKLKLATAMGRFGTIGEDLVNACVNDVVACGAKPLFFLDYVAVGRLVPEFVQSLVEGMARACREAECALIGGETAQMPGVYAAGDFDMAGFAVGAVERDEMLDPSRVREGDVLVGIPSSGLHTNGYSLVRQVFGLDGDPSPLFESHSRLAGTLGDDLMTPHRGYYQVVRPAFGLVKAIAHITGGGLVENVPRVLPDGLAARFDTSAWSVPPIFDVIQEAGGVSWDEMYRVFNMGMGMVLVCEETRLGEVTSLVAEARLVGSVVRATDGRRVLL